MVANRRKELFDLVGEGRLVRIISALSSSKQIPGTTPLTINERQKHTGIGLLQASIFPSPAGQGKLC